MTALAVKYAAPVTLRAVDEIKPYRVNLTFDAPVLALRPANDIVDLNDFEIELVEGGVAPVVAYGVRMGVGGTIVGVANAWNHYANTGRWSWGAFGRGFVAGAVGAGAIRYLSVRGM